MKLWQGILLAIGIIMLVGGLTVVCLDRQAAVSSRQEYEQWWADQAPAVEPSFTEPSHAQRQAEYKPPSRERLIAMYLRGAEIHQEKATIALNKANDMLAYANRWLAEANECSIFDEMYADYMKQYQLGMSAYQDSMREYASHLKQAREYMLKAERVP